MTGREIRELLDAAADRFPQFAERIHFDPGRTVNDSSTNWVDGRVDFNIGIKELVECPDREYSTAEAMVPIVGFFHEVCGHGGQFLMEFNKKCPLSEVLAVNYVACKGSPYYYGFFNGKAYPWHFKHPHEIAAQYIGIKSAYAFLSDEWKNGDDALDALSEYVRYRAELGCEFVKPRKEYENVDAMLSDFNDAFYRGVFSHHEYDMTKASVDALHIFAAKRSKPTHLTSVERCLGGRKQDRMMAIAFLDVFDGRGEFASIPALSSVDLHSDEAIRSTFALLCSVKPKPTREQLDLSGLEPVPQASGPGLDGPV